MDDEFIDPRKPSGITEHLRRWGWHLPEGYEPIRLEDCRKCHELALIVQGGGSRPLKLNRDGTLHTLHPSTTSLPIAPLLPDFVLSEPQKIRKT